MHEPKIHSHIEDSVPTDHPLFAKSVHCVDCEKMLQAGDEEEYSECCTTWIETGCGNFCVLCFSQRTDTDCLSHKYAVEK